MNEGVEVVPSDTWVEILRRIPAADLLRLKAVCKAFYALISDDYFVQLHHNNFTKHPKPIIISTDPTTPPYQKNYDPDKRTISACSYNEPRFDDWCTYSHDQVLVHRHKVIDMYHGLLLVEICDNLLVCNPITRSYKFLPLTYCPSLSISGGWKLGYDDVLEQYKVFGLIKWYKVVTDYAVCLYMVYVNREGYKLKVLRDTTGSEIKVVKVIKGSVLVNGNVHWLVITRDGFGFQACQGTCIISANLATDAVKIRTCSSTKSLLLKYNNSNVFAANGTFYQLRTNYDSNYESQLWVLEGVESDNPNPSWRMKHRIDFLNSTYSTLRNYPYYMTRVFGMFRDKILIMIWPGDNPKQLYQYDLSREEFDQVTIIGHDMTSSKSFRIIEHVQSLIRF